MKRAVMVAGLGSALLLVACGGGEGGPSSLTLGITDAPVDNATQVVVQFSGVDLLPAEGPIISIEYDQPKPLDLLALQGGLRDTLLEDHVLAAGRYEQIRLKVSAQHDSIYDSFITVDGAMHELRIPSGDQTGLKLATPFEVAEGEELDLTIDFDLRKSVVNAPGEGYLLKPTLRLVVTETSGAISGTVDPNVFAEIADCSADPLTGYGVYVYRGAGTTADDLGSANAPVVTASVTANDAGNYTGNYTYTATYLPEGDYTVAVTCQADLDAPDADDTIAFLGNADVTVHGGAATAHEFQ